MDWQTPVALTIVGLAAAGLVRAYWPRKGSAGCGKGCGSCSVNASTQSGASNLVSLQSLLPDTQSDHRRQSASERIEPPRLKGTKS